MTNTIRITSEQINNYFKYLDTHHDLSLHTLKPYYSDISNFKKWCDEKKSYLLKLS